MALLAHLGRPVSCWAGWPPAATKYGCSRQGQSYAETLIREAPGRVEGHYWLAMNLCGRADVAASSWDTGSCLASSRNSSAP